jgi:hypothetical protein
MGSQTITAYSRAGHRIVLCVPGMPSPAELKSVTTTPVLHWKKKKIQCGCTCVYELLIAFSKFLTERHAHIRQQSEAVGLSCFCPQK